MNDALLHEVLDVLERRGTTAGLIGAVALAAHGIVRATLDYDLLVLDRGVLEAAAWTKLAEGGAVVEIRRGDLEDPLAGVVRISREGQAPVDLVVGKSPFLDGVLARRQELVVRGRRVPVVLGADLLLLKVFAGGPQDLLDAETLLAGDEDGRLRRELESRLADLPAGLRREVSALLVRRPG